MVPVPQLLIFATTTSTVDSGLCCADEPSPVVQDAVRQVDAAAGPIDAVAASTSRPAPQVDAVAAPIGAVAAPTSDRDLAQPQGEVQIHEVAELAHVAPSQLLDPLDPVPQGIDVQVQFGGAFRPGA